MTRRRSTPWLSAALLGCLAVQSALAGGGACLRLPPEEDPTLWAESARRIGVPLCSSDAVTITPSGTTWVLYANGRTTRVPAPRTAADRDSVLALAASLAAPLPGGFPGLPPPPAGPPPASPATAHPPTTHRSTSPRPPDPAPRPAVVAPAAPPEAPPAAPPEGPPAAPPAALPAAPALPAIAPAEADLPPALLLSSPPARPPVRWWAEAAGGLALRAGVQPAPFARVGAWRGAALRVGAELDIGAAATVAAWPDVSVGRDAAGVAVAWGGDSLLYARSGIAGQHFTAGDTPDRWAITPTAAIGARLGAAAGPIHLSGTVEALADLALLDLTRQGATVTTLSPITASLLFTISAPLAEPGAPARALPP